MKKYAVYRPTHKGNTRWMTRPLADGEPENYPYIYEGEDALMRAWEKAKELNGEGARVKLAA
jgi:hypothetical protein